MWKTGKESCNMIGGRKTQEGQTTEIEENNNEDWEGNRQQRRS